MMPASAPPGASILVVDDMPANVLLLVRMLAERGYRPRPVSSGPLALESARAERPELILLDINMPEMNGYEVCAQLKADAALKDIPVIFISALHETMDKVKAFRAGAVDYVTKPFQFEEVYARVQTHLQMHRLETLRDDLTHMVIHDLRNPLSVIFGFLHVLKVYESQNLSASALEFAALARNSAEELRTMISSILDVSKLGAGQMKLHAEPGDIVALARAAMEENRDAPGNRSVILDAPTEPLLAPVDGGLIRRVFQNLLSNALRYTPNGGTVRMVIAPSGGDVRATITDSGPGIAAENHQRIFEKFGQVHDPNSRQGTGLGLTFCKLAVEAHAGHIGVESEVGHGSTFWLTLPRCPVTL
jgi:signal transduction histidine kinase